jgi:GTP-dependent phosphoenolpyruvate carboxykinase
MTGLTLKEGVLDKLFEIDLIGWRQELKGIKDFFGLFKKDLPKELWKEYKNLQSRIK